MLTPTTPPCHASLEAQSSLLASAPLLAQNIVSPRRELAATQSVLPQVIDKRGLNVTEVAHDYQVQVTKYIMDTPHLTNSYDTWQGTTEECCEGSKGHQTSAKKNEGRSWFAELSDKRKSIKISLYWAMKNCGEDPKCLQQLILNNSKHYQNDHSSCHRTSRCHIPGYNPTKVRLTSPAAIAALKSINIYKYARFYCRCRDTFWVESFNYALLTYLPKHIHFGSTMFEMRMNLALCDWNENIQRPPPSSRLVVDRRHPDRRMPMKVLVDKTFSFVDRVWDSYVANNCEDTSPLEEDITEDADSSDLEEDGEVIDEEIDCDHMGDDCGMMEAIYKTNYSTY